MQIKRSHVQAGFAIALLLFVVGLVYQSESKTADLYTAEVVALQAGDDVFKSGLLTPASCGVNQYVCDGKQCTYYTDYPHAEYGGACSPPYNQGYYQGYYQGSYGPAAPSFSVSPNPITVGESATISWSCVDSDSSSGLNFSTGGAVSGSVEVTPTETTTYGVQCSNGGSSSEELEVVHPDLSIAADPSRVRQGGTSTITWSAEDVNSCTVSGPGLSSTATSGSETVTINEESTYTLTCDTDGGEQSASVTVRLIPAFEEF